MDSFQTLLSSLSPDSSVRGKQFEKIVKWYFENEPLWKLKVSKVWLWEDYPKRWGVDKGIDLICRFKDGEEWAVQAKCYDKNYTITKSDIDKFLSESNRKSISGRILVATTNNIGNNAVEVIRAQEKHVAKIQLYDLENSVVEFPSDFKSLLPVHIQPIIHPKDYQLRAINDVVKGFQKSKKGQLILPCGTGKTYTSLWIKESYKCKSTLVLVPSLSLLSQTLHEWTLNKRIDFDILCVCSDETVKNSTEDHIQHLVYDLAFPVTTDAKEIKRFLKSNNDKVIFSTYQSSPQIAKVQKDKQIPQFDLVIADEAHRCAGVSSTDFSTVLNDTKIRASKKLFMTATPRIFTTATQNKAEERDVEIISMDDEKVFGKVFYQMTFGEAIEKGYLTDYKVAIVGVDEPMMKKWIDKRELVKTKSGIKTDAKNLAAHIGFIKTVKDYNLKKIISFHNRVQLAKQFAEEQQEILKWIPKAIKHDGVLVSDYVSGEMSASKRNAKLKRLKELEENEIGLLANARCLAEGVNVPTLDGVIFVDPRRSQVDIVQAVGRAIRLSQNKTHGTIILPVFIDVGEDSEKKINESAFKPIWDVLNALKSHDNILAEELNSLRTEIGRSGNFKGEFSKFSIDLPVTVGTKFIDSIKTRILEVTTKNWIQYYGLLQKYKNKFGDCRVPIHFRENDYNLGKWVSHQRLQTHPLSTDKKNKLDNLGFIWDPNEDDWNQGYSTLLAYKNEYGDCRVSQKSKYRNIMLGAWVNTQRQNYEFLSKEKRDKLSRINFIWNVIEHDWNYGLELLIRYKEEYGNIRVPQRFIYNKYQLGSWVSNQRYKKEKLPKEKITKLDKLGFVWNPFDEDWNQGYVQLKKYKIKHGNCMVPNQFASQGYKLGLWVSNQRADRGIMSEEKKRKLDKIGFSWNPLDDIWNKGYELLFRYKKDNGHFRVPQNYKTSHFNLGKWTYVQRQNHQKLSKSRKNRLNNVGFTWDPLEEDWNQGYAALTRYKKEFGNTRVPQRFNYNNYQLGSWVSSQRHNIKKISIEREIKLNNLGFIWNLLENDWNQGYAFMVQYKNKYGDCRVPFGFSFNKFELGYWVANQRQDIKKISKEKKDKLNELGFLWNPLDDNWNKGYAMLQKYIKEHGDCKVPVNFSYDKYKLGNWVGTQRSKIKSLTIERKEKLDKLGFIWKPKDDAWMQGYIILNKYKTKNGNCLAPQNIVFNNYNLGKWVNKQRQRVDKLSKERKEKLNKLGFIWKIIKG